MVTGSRGTGLIGLWSSLAAFLSLTKGYAAIGIQSSASSGSDSGIRSMEYSVGFTTLGCTYTCMTMSSSSGRSGTIALSTKLAAQLTSFQTRIRMIDISTMVSLLWNCLLITYEMYAMKSNSTAHIRNAVCVGAASLRRRMINFICDVCDVNRDTYDPGAPGGLYLVHLGRNVLKLSGS